jgi:hypothetical protein
MPPSSSDIKIVLDYTKTAASVLEGISEATNMPILKAVSGAIMPVISMVQVGPAVVAEAVLLKESRISGPIGIGVSRWSI